jgi:amino acid permease
MTAPSQPTQETSEHTPTPANVILEAQELQKFLTREEMPYSAGVVSECVATIAALLARNAELEKALEPFAEIAPFVEFTAFRDGNIVHRQYDREGLRHELTKDHFRFAAKVAALKSGGGK